jgi:glycerophosphoryl diester phosphodiesterase
MTLRAPGPSARPAFPYLDWPGPIAFAHRGGALENPENTMKAFQHAVAIGYRYVETDVQVTSDGVAVVFHDDTLDRVTDRLGRISDLPWSEVSQARVAGTEPIPRFDELLAAWPELRVNVEPKRDPAVAPLADVIRRAGAVDRVCVASFSDARVARARRLLGPHLCTAAGVAETLRVKAAAYGLPVGDVPSACLQVAPRFRGLTLVDHRFMATAHGLSLPVHVWTIDGPGVMRRLLDLGVAGIMTDRPTALRQVLEDRGQWFE